MAANESNITRFPGGVGQFTFITAGGAAGAHTVTGVKATDKLMLVQYLPVTTGVPGTGADLTGEFSITADDTVDNTSGTSTAGGVLMVTVARTKA